jgi:hypothetical protein
MLLLQLLACLLTDLSFQFLGVSGLLQYGVLQFPRMQLSNMELP